MVYCVVTTWNCSGGVTINTSPLSYSQPGIINHEYSNKGKSTEKNSTSVSRDKIFYFQGKHQPFSPSPLRLNIFRLFVILSLTQLYRYTPAIFLFSTATFIYTYPPPPDELDMNSQRTWLNENFRH